ncbi:MAG: trypsin-like peptidase domain-containing protein [Candidatus Omnitrophota bacterium]|nr:trypsin-like peptidase domain-containing protein [Candidatus Omnitrophota bacterium]MDZ4243316.1 trypsin-like peptidase domain-containing protein [Candidatus Omnitrophota bacterium]
MTIRASLWLVPVLWTAGPALAQTSIIDQMQRTQQSVVSIRSDNTAAYQSKPLAARDPQSGRIVILRNVAAASYRRQGAGVVIHGSGVIVTNAHVVEKAQHIFVTFSDGTEFPADVIGFEGDIDMALLKVVPPRPIAAVPLADSDRVELGDEIFTIGSSAFLKQTLTGGKVIGLGTNRTEQNHGRKRVDLLQTTVNLYEGDSGGPLFNRDGQLIGLMTAKETAADHSSFAVPSNKIALHLWEYLKTLQEKP